MTGVDRDVATPNEVNNLWFNVRAFNGSPSDRAFFIVLEPKKAMVPPVDMRRIDVNPFRVVDRVLEDTRADFDSFVLDKALVFFFGTAEA